MEDSLISVNVESVQIGRDDLDESGVTPAQEVWQNECLSPKLLPHKFTILECLIDQIEGMEENISKSRDKGQLKVSLHRLETMRISHICNHYVRTRLSKIEKNPRVILAQHEQRSVENKAPLLSESEKAFATRYADSHDALLTRLFLEQIPVSLQKVPVPETTNVYDRAFIRVLQESLEPVTVPNLADANSEIPLDLEKDSIYLIPFVPIIKHLEEGKVRLV